VEPGFPITPIDPTAAGDTFCGVLTAALSKGLSLLAAAKMANAAGALACTRAGAQPSIPTHAELQTFLSTHHAVSQTTGK